MIPIPTWQPSETAFTYNHASYSFPSFLSTFLPLKKKKQSHYLMYLGKNTIDFNNSREKRHL